MRLVPEIQLIQKSLFLGPSVRNFLKVPYKESLVDQNHTYFIEVAGQKTQMSVWTQMFTLPNFWMKLSLFDGL